MAAFMVRVELHQADWSDYELLHAAMEQHGFSRTITGDDGHRYHLPTAEYYLAGNVTAQQVLDAAGVAANTTRKPYGIFVSEATSFVWRGLQLA